MISYFVNNYYLMIHFIFSALRIGFIFEQLIYLIDLELSFNLQNVHENVPHVIVWEYHKRIR